MLEEEDLGKSGPRAEDVNKDPTLPDRRDRNH